MLKIVVLVLCVILFLVFAGIVYDTNRFVTIETDLVSDKIKKDIKVVVLSDLHNKSYGKDNWQLLSKINEINPDMIWIAGDVMNAHPDADFEVAVKLLNYLADKYKILYGMGNHEHRMKLYPDVYGDMSERYWEAVKHPNIVPLVNEKVLLEEYGICVYGSQIDRKFYKRFKTTVMEENYLQSILGAPKKDAYNVLIAHNPDYFPDYAKWGADLVLSGHVHGGIVRLPLLGGVVSPRCRFFPKYDGGIFKEGGSTMLLSRGLGVHTIPVRLFNPGELHVLTLCSK